MVSPGERFLANLARWPMTARSSTRAKEKDPVGKIKIETGYKEFRCIREQEYGG